MYLTFTSVHLSAFVYNDKWDFLRENGEVGLVLGIRERP
jgi:hypothetical protein